MPFHPRLAQAEIDDGSFSRRGIYPDGPAMPPNDALTSRQSHSGTFEVPCRVEPVERLEDFRGVAHAETRAVIPHEVDHPSFVCVVASHLDVRGYLLRGEFPRVANQVRHQGAKEPHVCLDMHRTSNGHRYFARRLRRLQVVDNG